MPIPTVRRLSFRIVLFLGCALGAARAVRAVRADLLVPATASHGREEFCRNAGEPNYFRRLALNAENQFSYANPGGPLGLGECWWMAHLEKDSLYLTLYRPDLPPPATAAEARALVRRILFRKGVTEIPGDANFRDFSFRWSAVIRKMIDKKEILDLIVAQKWILAAVPTSLTPVRMRAVMEEIHGRVEEGRQLTFIIDRFPGPLSQVHGLIIVEMEPTADGYDVRFLDSNWPGQVMSWRYHFGDAAFPVALGGHDPEAWNYWGAPNLQQNLDDETLHGLIRAYCR